MCLPLVLYSATYSASKSIRGQVRCILIMKETSNLQRDFLLAMDKVRRKCTSLLISLFADYIYQFNAK